MGIWAATWQVCLLHVDAFGRVVTDALEKRVCVWASDADNGDDDNDVDAVDDVDDVDDVSARDAVSELELTLISAELFLTAEWQGGQK